MYENFDKNNVKYDFSGHLQIPMAISTYLVPKLPPMTTNYRFKPYTLNFLMVQHPFREDSGIKNISKNNMNFKYTKVQEDYIDVMLNPNKKRDFSVHRFTQNCLSEKKNSNKIIKMDRKHPKMPKISENHRNLPLVKRLDTDSI